MEDIKTNNIFKILSTQKPSPTTELEYKNGYTLLVAIILSAQATDISVNKATKNLFQRVTSPQEMLQLGKEGLKQYIKSIGLYNSKADNIIKMSECLCQKYNGQVPEDFQYLIGLPGVGRKTANVWLNCFKGVPTMPVDTHVSRVANRLGLASSRKPDQIEKQLLQKISSKWLISAHHWLILHGRYVCTAKQPKCQECLISQYCDYYQYKQAS